MLFLRAVDNRKHVHAVFFQTMVLVLSLSAVVLAELKPGTRAPSFREKDVNGRVVDSKQLSADAMLLDFWSTWAKPCETAMPQWESLHRKYRGKGLVVIGVAMDEDPKLVAPYLKKRSISYEVLLDAHGKVSDSYSVREQPTTYLIDRQGIIRYVYPGYKPGLEKTVEQNVLLMLKRK